MFWISGKIFMEININYCIKYMFKIELFLEIYFFIKIMMPLFFFGYEVFY